ncbi:hypothetical protein [Rubripirellula amarantea]|nr:hypothetical protein [Rubripirellula amarantea]
MKQKILWTQEFESRPALVVGGVFIDIATTFQASSGVFVYASLPETPSQF